MGPSGSTIVPTCANRLHPSRRWGSFIAGNRDGCGYWCSKCQHHAAASLAPFVIRFGPDASSDIAVAWVTCHHTESDNWGLL